MDSNFTLLVIAIGLSMDSFAVSISNGLAIPRITFQRAVPIAFSLAFFQALMPLLGWLSGVGLESYIKEFDHWIAFILLGIIGGKMVYEGLFESNSISPVKLKKRTIVMQSIATSIDAFVVGISFAFLSISIVKPVVLIGFVTFIFSMLGLLLGKIVGQKIGKPAEIFGGLVLIGIGTKILIEHIYY